MSVPWGNSSSISALPVLAWEIMRSRPGMRRRCSSCSTMISFSTSCGVAPGHEVRTEMMRASRSGIIWMGTRTMARTPNRHTMRMPTATMIWLFDGESKHQRLDLELLGDAHRLPGSQYLVATNDHEIPASRAAIQDLDVVLMRAPYLDVHPADFHHAALLRDDPDRVVAIGLSHDAVARQQHRIVRALSSAGEHAPTYLARCSRRRCPSRYARGRYGRSRARPGIFMVTLALKVRSGTASKSMDTGVPTSTKLK